MEMCVLGSGDEMVVIVLVEIVLVLCDVVVD